MLTMFGTSVSEMSAVPATKAGEPSVVGLRALLSLKMPKQPNRIELILSQLVSAEPELRQFADRMVILYEPHYHFELQAIERAWGIIKGAVSRKPTYKLSTAVQQLEKEFRERLKPAVCKKLCDKVRRQGNTYLFHDLKRYGINGYEPDVMCCSSHCRWVSLDHKAGGEGSTARNLEVRVCQGCGWGWHESCLINGMSTLHAPKAWPKTGYTCWCGCEVNDLTSDSGESGEGSGDEGQIDEVADAHAISLVEQIKLLIQGAQPPPLAVGQAGPGAMRNCR